ncbi:MAG: adenylate/guanylate cyclase domain-containing protein [Rhodospirillales bacterium]|nr:adenylate/guanylate cyclase domain-containing protein [Rhodospirillales bacterium]
MPPDRGRGLQMTDPTGAVATHVDRAFVGLERRAEHILAGIRLLALLVLALVFRVVGTVDQGYPTMVPLGGLAAITLITLWLVRLGLFRPWLSWLFATLDVAFLTHCLVVLAHRNGQSLELALNTPVALLVYVFLATAAVRHRPLLILYTGGLFIATWAAIWLWDWRAAGGEAWLPGTWTAALAWLAAVGLTSYALFVAVWRARRTAVTAIAEAHLRENLSRYFSPKVVDEIAQNGGAVRSFRAQKAAILFIDLRGFTSLAERMPADKVAAFLNDYRRRVGEPIARHHGIIDKFIGDGAMAIFGVPEPRGDDARNAVLAGVALVSVINAWRSERLAEGLPPVEVGIGIHYGDVTAGALGDENRLEYTVVGDAVNTAARIERLAADLGTPLLVSADVLAAAPGLQQDLQLAEPVTHLLRGRSQPIRLYQLAVDTTVAGERRA